MEQIFSKIVYLNQQKYTKNLSLFIYILLECHEYYD